jgi:hypothetical protein
VGAKRTLQTKSKSLRYGVSERSGAAALQAADWTPGSRGKAIVLLGSNDGYASAFEQIASGDGQCSVPLRAELLLSKPSTLPHLFVQWEQSLLSRDTVLKVDLVERQDIMSDLPYFDLFFRDYFAIARGWELHRAATALEQDDIVFARSRLQFEARASTLQEIARDFLRMWMRLASDPRVACDSFPILNKRVENSYDRAFYNWLVTYGMFGDYADNFPVNDFSI